MKKSTIQIDSYTFSSLLEKDESIAFEALFRLYYDKLLHIAIGYLMEYADAEEVVQDVFLKLWEKRNKLKKIDNINGYLYRMTKNKCLDYIKHNKIKLSHSKNDYDKRMSIQYQFIKDEAASLLLENELKKKITESIALLPEKCKCVFIKSRMEGMKHQEIAEIMGLSKRTVDNHISNALQHMRHHLREFLTVFCIFFNLI